MVALIAVMRKIIVIANAKIRDLRLKMQILCGRRQSTTGLPVGIYKNL